MKYTKEELKHSKRIYKSATPKQDLSWYVKWTGSAFLICAFALRSTQEYPFLDLCFSLVGVSGWLWVGLLWKDRALIILNAIAVFILLSGLLKHLTPILIA
tara:strand:- start:386 stop:688 length:303 start_codon:yes stop_codon:yes gene_type:complete